MTAWYWPVLQPVALSISSYQLTICHWHHSKGLVTSLHSHNYYKTKTKFPYISVLPLVFFCLFLLFVLFLTLAICLGHLSSFLGPVRTSLTLALCVWGFCAYAVEIVIEMCIMFVQELLRIFFFWIFLQQKYLAHFIKLKQVKNVYSYYNSEITIF